MRLWDFLFLLLVAAPIFTGGVWFRGEGIKIEYTQPAIAAAVLFLWALWLKRKGKAPLEESASLSFIQRAFKKWQSAVTGSFWPLLFAWICISIVWFLAALSRHLGFHSHAADLGIFTNGIFNLAETGSPFSSIKGFSLLSDHQNFLIYPIALLFKLLPSPVTLLALQSLALSAAGIALFLLGRQWLGRDAALPALLPLLFWVYAPVRAANLYDFHPEVVMLPLFLFAAWGLQETSWPRRIAGFLLFFSALAAKESAGPVAAGLGLAWLVGAGPLQSRGFTRIFGGFALLMGIGAFYFDTKLMPELLGTGYAYSDVYAPFGSSLTDLAKAPFLHPQEFFSRIFGPARLKFFFFLLFPFLFLPMLGWRAMLAAVPGFLMLFLTEGNQRLSTGFHYAIEPAVGVLFALPAGLAVAKRMKWAPLLFVLLPLAAILQLGRSEVYHWRMYSLNDHQRWVRSEVLPGINQARSVGANSALTPHLATRRWIHFLPFIEKPEGLVECIVWEHTVNQTPMGHSDVLRLNQILEENYEPSFQCETLFIYRKRGAEPCHSPSLTCRKSS